MGYKNLKTCSKSCSCHPTKYTGVIPGTLEKCTVQNTVPHSRTAGYEQTSRLLLWTRGKAKRMHLTSAATAALTGSGLPGRAVIGLVKTMSQSFICTGGP